jgi:hypothetical protein
MTTTLLDFIQTRRLELDKLEAPLQERLVDIQRDLATIKAERDQLDTAENAIQSLDDQKQPVTRRSIPEMTIKAAVVKVLRTEPLGLPAVEILRRINAELKTDYARTSLSPQLSRLKQDGKIALMGENWRLIGLEGFMATVNHIAHSIEPSDSASAREPSGSHTKPTKW